VDAFIWPIRVYYEDTDSGGLVYHANYIKYLERARSEWLRQLGYEQSALAGELRIIFAVRSLQIDYLKPARLDDRLEIETRLQHCGRASLVFEQTAVRKTIQRELLGRAAIKLAVVDADTLKPRALPETLRAEIAHAG
jgi:acyl-CoA thioester hydrolase